MADQLGKSVGDMYKGAFLPGFMLMGLYVVYVVFLAIFKPAQVPALPPEARTFREPNGSGGYISRRASPHCRRLWRSSWRATWRLCTRGSRTRP